MALVIHATITVMGMDILRRADFSDRNVVVAVVALGVGLLPILAPGLYDRFPEYARIILGRRITTTAFVAFGLDLLFDLLGRSAKQPPQAGRAIGNLRRRTPPRGAMLHRHRPTAHRGLITTSERRHP